MVIAHIVGDGMALTAWYSTPCIEIFKMRATQRCGKNGTYTLVHGTMELLCGGGVVMGETQFIPIGPGLTKGTGTYKPFGFV